MTDDLLELALSDPDSAWARGEEILATSTDPDALATAHQAKGIVLRNLGNTQDALVELRSALRLAARVGSEREAHARATYGGTLFVAGRTRQGLRELDRAAAGATGTVLATVLMRRAWVLAELGRWQAAESDTNHALRLLHGRGRLGWEARTLVNRGVIELALGRAQDADGSFAAAEGLFLEHGHVEDALHAYSNRGAAAYLRGDLPRALAIFSEIDLDRLTNRWLRLGIVWDRYEVYLAAGLIAEAVELVEHCLTSGGYPQWARSDLNLALAHVRLASGRHDGAVQAARDATRGFRRQDRQWLERRARLVGLRSRLAAGADRGLYSEAARLARTFDEHREDEAAQALVMAGRLARGPERGVLLIAATGYRRHSVPLVRASAWLASAINCMDNRDRAGVLRACGQGLNAIDAHRQVLGSSELRALATSHGRELAELALIHAATNSRTLLRWSERWRSTALAMSPMTTADEPSAELIALRENGRRLVHARKEGESLAQLESDRTRLERAVRAEHHRRTAKGVDVEARFDVDRFVAEIGADCMVELVEVDGDVHVVVIHGGKVRRRLAGSTEEALQFAANARSALRRAARGRPYAPGDLGVRLQEALLGQAADLIPDGPVVICPTGRLHAVPWSMLPVLADRPFSIVPSAAQWQRARAVPKPRKKKVVLLAAPGLGSGGSEVPKLARRYKDATVLRGKKATVEAALAGLDGASLAHVAAHGRFREDSPLFSSLEMADGSLSVYELERLKRAPYRLILSACESGVLAPVGADELLGLTSALFSMGTAGLVCSIAEVNDEATAALMVDLHEHLAAHPKEGLAGALLAARRAAQGDPTREATAAAFLALGI